MGPLDLIRKARREESAPKNRSGNGRKKAVSGRGKGKWRSNDHLAAYREARNKANKRARLSRRRNRA